MTWKLLLTLLTFVAIGLALVTIRPAVSPWYFADFRLDRSAGSTVEAELLAMARRPDRPPTKVTRLPAPQVETTGFASK